MKIQKKKIVILIWWKDNAHRLSLLVHMAQDVLAIPISTVALESVFSTSGCILEDFRTSLTLFMLEVLVCTQDWPRRSTPIDIQDNIEELAIIEKELIEEFGNGGKGKIKESASTSKSQATATSSRCLSKE